MRLCEMTVTLVGGGRITQQDDDDVVKSGPKNKPVKPHMPSTECRVVGHMREGPEYEDNQSACQFLRMVALRMSVFLVPFCGSRIGVGFSSINMSMFGHMHIPISF